MTFGDRLNEAVKKTASVSVIGIDPRVESLPDSLREIAEKDINDALSSFGKGIVDAVAGIVPAVKPNIAFFEAYGIDGLRAYDAICRYAKDKGLLVVGDVKRGDIGSTAEAYAKGLLEPGWHDALTLNPYLGSDSLNPFFEVGEKIGAGFFVLVKTSNPSSAELQDLKLEDGSTLAESTAKLVASLGEKMMGESGMSSIGAVVGATHPDELGRYRELMPKAPFLIPGYGAQGGSAADIVGAFNSDGTGGIVNASRSVIFAWKKEDNAADWQGAARRAAVAMNEDLASALKAAGKWNL